MYASFFISLLAFAAAVAETGQIFDVNMSGLFYFPSNITIKVGDTVKWHFDGNKHSVTQAVKVGGCTQPKGGFDSGEVTSSTEVFTQTFTVPGEYPYYCKTYGHCHGGMKGIVIVQ